MTGIMSLWLPILLSAVAVFVISSIIHMVSPWHKDDYKRLPDEDAFRAGVGPLAIPPGDYMVPRPMGRQEMARILQTLSEEGVSIVISSHILSELESLCKSILILNWGRILASGSQREIRSDLKNWSEELSIEYDEARLTPEAIAAKVKELGYEARPLGGAGELRFGVKGLHCASCVATLEKKLLSHPAVSAAVVNLAGAPIAFVFAMATIAFLAITTRTPLTVVVSRMDDSDLTAVYQYLTSLP